MLLYFLLIVGLTSGYDYKRLAGPPAEFESMRIPSPLQAAISEESALLPVKFTSPDFWEGKIAADSKTVFQLVFLTTDSDNLELDLFYPDGSQVDLDKFYVNGEWPVSSTGAMVQAKGWRFVKQPRGYYKVRISKKDGSPLPAFVENNGAPSAYLLLWNESTEKIFSHLGTYFWDQGKDVGITAHMYDSAEKGKPARGTRPTVLTSVAIMKASLDVYRPDGQEMEVDMKDDGTTFDLLANDNVYGGKFEASETGMYRITALFEGTLEDGTPFMRSVEHGMTCVPNDISFQPGSKVAYIRKLFETKDQLSIHVPVDGPAGTVVRAYAEVYGTDVSSGVLKSACWIGGYTTIENGEMELELNKKWLAAAGVQDPLVLKNVYIANQRVHVPQALEKEFKVSSPSLGKHLSNVKVPTRPTEEMLKGVRPAHLRAAGVKAKRMRYAQANLTQATLVLLHGYCAKNNPWLRTSNVPFTDYVAQADFGQSRLNSEIAEKVLDEFGDLPSWGIVAHSQGGMVALEIHNYFWSPNDAVTSGRPIQSMGTPYYGVSGAGAALDLGTLFGLGCGENSDLTTDGAALWLSGLQPEAASGVYYYTTYWKETFLQPRYCNLAVNLVLQWPNDGTSEYDQSQLKGATQVEHYEGECHSEGMKWPPQTENIERNARINAEAGR